MADSVIAPIAWMTAIAHLGAPRVSIFMNFIPVLTVPAAVAFLGKSLHYYHLIRGALNWGAFT
ncbi:EamA family transporter [Pseudomonas sp. PGPR40]|uniref:EamA family transporter n=1 Tax=Pseudomonas sp. PGPR40 TaxID=2913476 RepID=UPI003FA70852